MRVKEKYVIPSRDRDSLIITCEAGQGRIEASLRLPIGRSFFSFFLIARPWIPADHSIPKPTIQPEIKSFPRESAKLSF